LDKRQLYNLTKFRHLLHHDRKHSDEFQMPIAAALPLFATGIGGLGLLGWRRKRKAQPVMIAQFIKSTFSVADCLRLLH
jgi:hypothetical protein